MLERIIELLLGLAVAAASAFGIGTATTTPHGPPADVGQPAQPQSLTAPESAGEGLATALSAIERAMEAAPDAADEGLQRAWDHVSTAGPPEGAGAPNRGGPPDDPASAADGAGDPAPIDVPAGPR